MMKNFILGLLALGFIGCAGYELGNINAETADGKKISRTDGVACVDDGKGNKGCVDIQKKEKE